MVSCLCKGFIEATEDLVCSDCAFIFFNLSCCFFYQSKTREGTLERPSAFIFETSHFGSYLLEFVLNSYLSKASCW